MNATAAAPAVISPSSVCSVTAAVVKREEPVVLRLAQLLAPEEDVAQRHPQATGRPISRAISASAAMRFSSGG